MTKKAEETVFFGFEKMSTKEKFASVDRVFDSVVNRYDLMNDMMSLGIHRLWKKYAVEVLDVGKNQVLLDLAAGTGDISSLIGKRLPKSSMLISCNANLRMLSVGRDKMTDLGLVEGITYVRSRAESLPFDDSTLDRAIIGFGLRNFSDQIKALKEVYRVLKVGARIVILEFSEVRNPQLSKLYDFYSFKVLPMLGKAIVKDSESYVYLAESIRKHPNQESLKQMIESAGFVNTQYFNFMSGIVAVHLAHKS